MSAPITLAKLAEVTTSLKEVPPLRFDLARQVRGFEPYLQYVELSLIGAAIQRHRLAIRPVGKIRYRDSLPSQVHMDWYLYDCGIQH